MLLIVVALLIAALGVYLLIIGAIAVVGWIVAAVAKQRPSSTTSVVVASTPSAAVRPEQPFQALVSVDRSAFNEPRRLEAVTVDVFNAWARRLPKAPRNCNELIRGMRIRHRLVGRMTTRLDGRRFVWRWAPYGGRDRVVGAPIDHMTLDPYAPPADLRVRSRYLSLCRACAGDGRVACTTCSGMSRLTCTACDGAGKVYGVTANGVRRMLNCKTCKGRASLACAACTRGELTCAQCNRSGRVENWLDIEGGPRDGDIQVEPDGDITRAFTWGMDGVPATHDEVARDAKVVCSVSIDREIKRADLPAAVPSEWVNAYWDAIQARLQPGERVVSQTFTLLEVPAIEVEYEVGGRAQSMELQGLRLLAPPASADQVFARRASSLRRLGAVLALAPFGTLVAYLARGDYFQNMITVGVVSCTAVAAALFYVVNWYTSLGATPKKWWLVGIAPLAAAVALAIVGEPTAANAKRLIEAGRLDEAKAELDGLGGSNEKALTPLWDRLHVRESLAATTCREASERLAQAHASRTADAVAHIDALALREATSALDREELPAVDAALACGSRELQTSPQARMVLSKKALRSAALCIERRFWTCAQDELARATETELRAEVEAVRAQVVTGLRTEFDSALVAAGREKDLQQRVAYQHQAFASWDRLAAVNPMAEPPEFVALRAKSQRDEQALAAQLKLEKAREEAAARRRVAEEERERKKAEAEAARELRRQQAAEERERRRAAREEAQQYEESGVLMCCDGTASPTCSCPGHRGCCSHHGGVCGCR